MRPGYNWLRLLPLVGVMSLLFYLSHLPGKSLHLPNIVNVDKALRLPGVCDPWPGLHFCPVPRTGGAAIPDRSPFPVPLFCLLYGIFDEFHQAFFPGTSGEWRRLGGRFRRWPAGGARFHGVATALFAETPRMSLWIALSSAPIRNCVQEIIPGREDRPVLVFLHEGLGSIGQWQDFPGQLCLRTGCHGLVYDRIGHGRSSGLGQQRTIHYLHSHALVELPLVVRHSLAARPYFLIAPLRWRIHRSDRRCGAVSATQRHHHHGGAHHGRGLHPGGD